MKSKQYSFKKKYSKKVSRKKSNRYVGVQGKYQKAPKEELKYWDLVPTASVTALNPAGTILVPCLNIVTQGAGVSQRVGKSITVKKIQGFMYFTKPGVGTAQFFSEPCRVWVILDTQKNGTAPTFLDIFQYAGTGTFNSMTNSRRFRILKKFDFIVNSKPYVNGVNLGATDKDHIIKFNIKCNIPITWSVANTDGDPSQITNNNILIAGVSGDGTVGLSGNTVAPFYSAFRIRYSD